MQMYHFLWAQCQIRIPHCAMHTQRAYYFDSRAPPWLKMIVSPMRFLRVAEQKANYDMSFAKFLSKIGRLNEHEFLTDVVKWRWNFDWLSISEPKILAPADGRLLQVAVLKASKLTSNELTWPGREDGHQFPLLTESFVFFAANVFLNAHSISARIHHQSLYKRRSFSWNYSHKGSFRNDFRKYR